MKSTRSKILITVLALCGLVALAVAQGEKWGHHGEGMGGDHMLSFMTDYLDLTEAQQAQIKDIMTKSKPAMESFGKQMGQTHSDISQIVHLHQIDRLGLQTRERTFH